MGPRDGERGGDERSLCFSVGIHDPRARVVDRCTFRDISTRAGVDAARAAPSEKKLSCRRHTYRFPRIAVRTRLGASHLPSFVTRASMFASAALARVAASAPTARHGARVSVPSRGASSRRSSHGTRGIVSSRAVRAAAGAPDGDKVCVITGSNTGLGYISALEIAKMPGHKVVMAVRDPAKGADAASRIARDAGADVDVMSCDLASLDSVRAFADAFAEKYDRCDILMNNAGVMALPDRALTLDGIEMQMGTNHAGHFLLTERMMPSILRAPGRPRVVNLSSVAHVWGHIDFDNIQSEGPFGYPLSGWLTYGRTKLANLYFTYELHRRLRASRDPDCARVDVNAVHPGIVDTELPRSLSLNFYPALRQSGGLITPEEGARGQIEVATGAAFEGVSGKYVAEQSGPAGRRGARKGAFEVAESSPWSYDADTAARFWKKSKALTGAEWKTLGEEGVSKEHVNL